MSEFGTYQIMVYKTLHNSIAKFEVVIRRGLSLSFDALH